MVYVVHANYLGLHLFSIQSRLRDKRRLASHMGCARVQAYRASQGLWLASVISGRAR